MDPLEEACMELLNRRKESQGDTEDKLFAKLLIKQMERLSDQRKRALQQHIMKVVSDAIDAEQGRSTYALSPLSQPLNTQLNPIHYEDTDSPASSNGGYYDEHLFPHSNTLLG